MVLFLLKKIFALKDLLWTKYKLNKTINYQKLKKEDFSVTRSDVMFKSLFE